MSTPIKPRKVGLIGTGMVGMSFAYSLIQRSLASELVLIDIDHERAVGEAMDLNHGLSFVRPMEIFAGDYSDLADANVIIITAGPNQKPGETRLDLLQRNADIIRTIIPRVVEVNRDAVIIIATNPVDIMTHVAVQMAGLPTGKVIGSGTILDTARFRYLLGEYYQVDPRSIHAYIVGEHGDSELALWSLANIAGVRLKDFVGAQGQQYDDATMDDILTKTRMAAYEIIERKRATYYAIGLGLLIITEAIMRDQHTVLTVSSPMNGCYGIDDMSISMPTIVGQEGAEQVLTLPISDAELAAFQQSAQTLTERLMQIK
jgi:L-lactate dehydrogenase